jgi:acetylornithine deacetylase/succinyl-diaminopimelate desuccinylase-like protein
MPQAKADLRQMISIRSVHDGQSTSAECERMVDFVLAAFADVGLDARAYGTSDGSRAVYGQRPGAPGGPTVLLYFHHDVLPTLDERAWDTAVWELTERNGRWYGRGAADCKGNIVALMTALRAMGDELPVTLKVVGGGSDEQRTGGLDEFVAEHAELLAADAILVGDAGNVAVGAPRLISRLPRTMSGAAHVTMTGAMRDAYGVPPVIQGQVRSVPSCDVFAETFPRAEIMLLGVEEPLCRIHAPNESVEPSEIANIALAEALFFQRYAAAVAS